MSGRGGRGAGLRGDLEPTTLLQRPLPPYARGCSHVTHGFSGEGGNPSPLLSFKCWQVFLFLFLFFNIHLLSQQKVSLWVGVGPNTGSGPPGVLVLGFGQVTWASHFLSPASVSLSVKWEHWYYRSAGLTPVEGWAQSTRSAGLKPSRGAPSLGAGTRAAETPAACTSSR